MPDNPLATPGEAIASSGSTVVLDIGKLAFESFASAATNIVGPTFKVASVASGGVIPLLTTFGAIMLLSSLTLKLEIGGTKIANLTPTEFVSAIAVSGVLLLTAGCLRAWTYKCQHELEKQTLGIKLRIIERNAGIVEKSLQAASDIAVSNTSIATRQLASGTYISDKTLKLINYYT